MLRLQPTLSTFARHSSSSSCSFRNLAKLSLYQTRCLRTSSNTATFSFPPSRSFSFLHGCSKFITRPSSSASLLPSRLPLFPTRRFQSGVQPEVPSNLHFVSALMLLGNAGKDLSQDELEFKLFRVVSAAGISTNESEINEFLKEEHQIVRCNEQQLVAIAMQLCIQGGEEQPADAQIARVLEVAGITMDSAQLSTLRQSIEHAAATPALEAGEQQPGSQGDQVAVPKSRWGAATAMATGAAVLMGKTKYVLVALKLTKMTPLISMMITSFAYSFVFGWPYALGMVGQMLLHESGHAAVMRHLGIPFSPMVFIPFMGAAVGMKDTPKSAYEEALVAFGGPVVGSAAAGLLAVLGVAAGSPLIIALADFGFMINLFNLLPIGTLDGGRIASALSPWINVVGLMGGGLLLYSGVMSNPIFYLIMLAGTYTTVMRFVHPPAASYTTLSPGQRAQVGFGYLGLIAFLLWAMWENNKRKLTPKQIQAVREGRLKTPLPSDPEAFYTDESWDLSVSENKQQRW